MFGVTKDIDTSYTLHADFYREDAHFQLSKEAIFTQSWHLLHNNLNDDQYQQIPKMILPDFLDESILMIRKDAGEIDILSNVCTHRGNILVNAPNNNSLVSCGYHGRCFNLNGNFRSMPFFEKTKNFPSKEDHLKKYKNLNLGPMLFGTLGDDDRFVQAIFAIQDRMPDFNFSKLHHIPKLSVQHSLKAHWALYVDNYLEGFHVPFVHPSLGKSLDMNAYHYEVFNTHNLQLGVAKDNEPCFNLSEQSPDFGKKIFAYYWWVFPNLMINCYPWGLSINSIEPITKELTQIRYETYLFNPDDAESHKQTNIEVTEMEDEAIVLQVQKGIQSSSYKRGRYSPVHERCVHQFHMLIQNAMSLD